MDGRSGPPGVDTPPAGRVGPYPGSVIRNLIARVWREAAKFGIIGLFNFALDAGLFNVLRHTVMSNRVITASIVSTSVAAVSSYFMNRHWTWRDRSRTGLSRELPMFLLLSAVGLGISTGCLAFSHYVLGYTSGLADNIAKNGFGLVLGMVWRFWSFKRWVFRPAATAQDSALEDAVNTTV